MGLFFKSNQDVLREALKSADKRTQMVKCPCCGTLTTATFLGKFDSIICRNCGTRVYPKY